MVEIKGTEYDPRKGTSTFEKSWVYISLISQVDVKIRVVAKFKYERHQKSKLSYYDQDTQLINQDDSYNFSGRFLSEQKNKINKTIFKLMNDSLQYDKLK